MKLQIPKLRKTKSEAEIEPEDDLPDIPDLILNI